MITTIIYYDILHDLFNVILGHIVQLVYGAFSIRFDEYYKKYIFKYILFAF